MGRPKKDPLAIPIPRKYHTVKVPVGVGRSVVVRSPVDGLTQQELELLRRFISVLSRPGDIDQDDDDQDDDDQDDDDQLSCAR